MTVEFESPSITEFSPDEAVDLWYNKQNRRPSYDRQKHPRPHTSVAEAVDPEDATSQVHVDPDPEPEIDNQQQPQNLEAPTPAPEVDQMDYEAAGPTEQDSLDSDFSDNEEVVDRLIEKYQ
ncbi:unnamed protein product [Owenia fusiformis]|uniref:Uncharacterized protein n=1 Tax=Owenia fusiformis TaxID=6347 RepID=A0A8S4QE90_OWEFU|nr:unnamed protein product [Owenia fusiformis]